MGLFKASETTRRIAHAIAGISICLEGWERFEEGARYAGIPLMVLGTLLLFFARFHTRLHQSSFQKHLDSAAFLLESLVIAIIAVEYFERGKHLLPWCYTGVAVVYLILAVRRRGRTREHAPD